MISSGEVFVLNADTKAEFHLLPQFLNQNIKVVASGYDRAYLICEPVVSPPDMAVRPFTAWCFEHGQQEPYECEEFYAIEEDIRQIAVGAHHLLVLTHSGNVYSYGESLYGSVGQGGAARCAEFKRIPALQNKKVRQVAAGPNFSVAVTLEGDVYSWGAAFKKETGLFQAGPATVPRFAHAVSPPRFRILKLACGDAHVLATTESLECIAWGENSSGQLGAGAPCRCTHLPVAVKVDAKFISVAAGWAHSVGITEDGQAYTWGLNTHGQLGLGDTKTRYAPHLVHALVAANGGNGMQVESAHGSVAFTLFVSSDAQALICGRLPHVPGTLMEAEIPRRVAEDDPFGCLLTPLPVELSLGLTTGGDPAEQAALGVARTGRDSQVSMIAAFGFGAICFARSSVYGLQPQVAPLEGGTTMYAYVTGLPYEEKPRFASSTTGGFEDGPLLQDMIQAKVRLSSIVPPICDITCHARIVDAQMVEFRCPDVSLSPIAPVVEDSGSASVSVQVSLDDGLTWTLHGATTLKFCKWPKEGPRHVIPDCAPTAGGTELLLMIDVAQNMPQGAITVAFRCVPKTEDVDEEGPQSPGATNLPSPVARDLAELENVPADQSVPVGRLDVYVSGSLDPQGRGVRCISPPLDPETVQYYNFYLEVSLDGKRYLPTALPFLIYNLTVEGLEPNVGPLHEPDGTQVMLRTKGAVESKVQKVRLDLPWGARALPGKWDYNDDVVRYKMPDLIAEVRERREDEQRALDARWEAEGGGAAQAVAAEGAGGEEGGEGGGEEGGGEAAEQPPQQPPTADPDGGLAALEVPVELSLNGQNFSEDRALFTYYGHLTPETVSFRPAPPQEGEEEPAEAVPVTAEDTLSLEKPELSVAVSGLVYSEFACVQFRLLKEECEDPADPKEEDFLPWKEGMNVKARVMGVGGPGGVGMTTGAANSGVPRLDFEVPSLLCKDCGLPEGTETALTLLSISLNGQHFVPVETLGAVKLQFAAPPEEPPQEE